MTETALNAEEWDHLAELADHGVADIVVDTRLLIADQDDAEDLHRTFVVLHALAQRGLVRFEICAPRSADAYIGWELTEAGRAALP